jgi:DNA-binding NarL/FixJ family response regulator
VTGAAGGVPPAGGRTGDRGPYSDRVARPVRLLLVDDHEVVRQGLAAMLSRYSQRIRVVGEAAQAAAAEELALNLKPDVVLCDVRLGASSGLDLCARLTELLPATRVVMLSVYDEPQYLYQALRAGAAGYLLKQLSGAQLADHLEQAAAGEVVIDSALAGRVALSAARLQSGEFWPGAAAGLTQRESEVLELLVAGLSNRAIAGRLVLGEETVKTHLRGLYRKLEVSDRAAAVTVALREGLFR